MNVFIFSDNKELEKHFTQKNNKTIFRKSFYEYNALRKIIKNNEEPALVYIDLDDKAEIYKKDLSYLLKKANVYTAILDPGCFISDISTLFLSGVVDYLSGDNIKTIFNENRLKIVHEYLQKFRLDYKDMVSFQDAKAAECGEYITASGWNEITEGKEYTFTLLYVEFDNKDELMKKHNKLKLSEALTIFKAYIERHVTPYNGKIWMWHNFGGIILFPYTGGKCQCVTSAFKIMLYKFIHDVEESLFPNFISFRIAMHLGNFVYHTVDTGNIISDSINSVFHLGKIFTETGNMTITEEIMIRTPEQLKTFFIPVGNYENRQIYRMRCPQFLVNP